MDRCRITVNGGFGGRTIGLGQSGATGGDGGHVYVQVSETAPIDFGTKIREPVFIGGDGEHSQFKRFHGNAGKDEEVVVPPGVTLHDVNGEVLVADLDRPGDRILVARGGVGESQQNEFRRECPRPSVFSLTLKLFADIGVVSFTNSGKSTFMNALSQGPCRQCKYTYSPFRTHNSTILYPDQRTVTLADVPNFTQGHEDAYVGLQQHFLAHLERTKILLFLVDLNDMQLHKNLPDSSPINSIIMLNREIDLYNQSLLNKPCLLVLNKVDINGGSDQANETARQVKDIASIAAKLHLSLGLTPRRLVKFDDIFVISEKDGTNIDFLQNRLLHWLDVYNAKAQWFHKPCNVHLLQGDQRWRI